MFFCFILIVCFCQLLRVQHSCSSTQSWRSVLPSIVETRDQNSCVYPLLFSDRNLGSFCGDRNPIHPQPLGSCGPLQGVMHEKCLIIIHDPGMRPGPESKPKTLMNQMEKWYEREMSELTGCSIHIQQPPAANVYRKSHA